MLAVQVIESFATNLSATVRIVCFHSGRDVYDFAERMERAKNEGKIPADVTLWQVVFSGANPDDTEIQRGIEAIRRSASAIVSATDYDRDFARKVLAEVPRSQIVFFGYQ